MTQHEFLSDDIMAKRKEEEKFSTNIRWRYHKMIITTTIWWVQLIEHKKYSKISGRIWEKLKEAKNSNKINILKNIPLHLQWSLLLWCTLGLNWLYQLIKKLTFSSNAIIKSKILWLPKVFFNFLDVIFWTHVIEWRKVESHIKRGDILNRAEEEKENLRKTPCCVCACGFS